MATTNESAEAIKVLETQWKQINSEIKTLLFGEVPLFTEEVTELQVTSLRNKRDAVLTEIVQIEDEVLYRTTR